MPENFELPSERINRQKKLKKRKKRGGCLLLVVIFILFTAILAGCLLVYKYMPSFRQMSPYSFFEDLDKNGIYIVLHDERLELLNDPVIEDGEVYIPVDFIKDYLDQYIFWEEGSDILTITTQDKVIKMNTDELDYYVNSEPFELSLPIRNINSMAYLPESMLETLYPVEIYYAEDYKMVVIDKTDVSKQIGQITVKNSNMRFNPDIKSPIEKKLTQGTEITVYGEATGKFTKVRTDDGLIGYIYTKDYTNTEIIQPTKIEKERFIPTHDGKIIMAWDQIYTYEQNLREDKSIAHKGVNVLSPTWFKFDEEKLNGYIINTADISYVNFAHENNMQVWALVTDNFKSKVSSAILTDPYVREYVIKQLLEFVAMYGLDGVNVDFESVSLDDAPYYLQFLRELAPPLHEQGAILSVDMFVPTYTMHYNRTEVAKVVDYVCVMAYDEHYGPASGSGPVASLGFVEDGISRTLEEVPKEKLIMGMPFYTRVWREEAADYGVEVSVDANLAMGYAEPRFERNDVSFEWLEDIGSHYGEYTVEEDGILVTYKVWLEDEVSIDEKLKIFEKYDLAGVAGWSRGLEKDEIWDLIDGYVNK